MVCTSGSRVPADAVTRNRPQGNSEIASSFSLPSGTFHGATAAQREPATGTGNRLLEEANYTYQYDAEGNRTQRTSKANGSREIYWWDHRNRLVRVNFRTATNVLTQAVAYDYDAFDNLIRRRVDGNGDGTFEQSQSFLLDIGGKGGLDDVVLAFDESGNVEHRYLHGDGIDELWADESATDGLLWALADQRGTVKDWAEHDSGTGTTTVTNHVEFDAYGNIVSQTNANHEITAGGYTGRYHDPLTGLRYHRERWTDPATGWLSPDPGGYAMGDVNLYRFVGNSPGNYVDPSGMANFPVVVPILAFFRDHSKPAPSISDGFTVYGNSRDAGYGKPGALYNAVGTGLATEVGVRGVSDACSRHDAVDAHEQSVGERVFDGATGSFSLVTTASGAGVGLKSVIANGSRTAQTSASSSVVRQRVLANIAESRAARESSNFDNWAFTFDPSRMPSLPSTAFQARLPSSMYPGTAARYHFREANTQLLNAMDQCPEFASSMETLIPRLRDQLVRPRSISTSPPHGWTWNHGLEPGQMLLVPSVQHWDNTLWPILHPGNRGGMAIWGGGY